MIDFKIFISGLNRTKTYLLVGNAFLVFFVIILNNTGILPMKNLGDFLFFSFITLIFALYRPCWAFVFFAGAIILENINLAPPEIGINVRPYQFLGGITILAVLIHSVLGRLNFKLVKFQWYDYFFILFVIAGFFSSIGAAERGTALKISVICATFVALYFLAKNYVQNFDDLKRIIPFFLSSSVIVVGYGIWQNIRFIHGSEPFETMPGRPNATFAEADWLGIYLVFLSAAIYSIIYYLKYKPVEKQENGQDITKKKFKLYFSYIYLVLVFVLLIISVSRSAWLGMFFVTVIFLGIILTKLKFKTKDWQWKKFAQELILIFLIAIISLFLVYVFNLTNFKLFNRAQSIGTGLQKITISCATKDAVLPKKIETINELDKFNCRHIDLEDIDREKMSGNIIREIYRQDPNVNIRKKIYETSWKEIANHPLLGIGWGNIGQILGKDERGTGFNSSNIFLEIWLGSGLFGLLAFSFILIYAVFLGIKRFYDDKFDNQILGLFIILGIISLIIPNIFNAGIFIGILWLFFGTIFIINENRN